MPSTWRASRRRAGYLQRLDGVVVSIVHTESPRLIRVISFRKVPPKAAISLRLDADVLNWFKAQGPGYQTRINAVLRAYKDEAA